MEMLRDESMARHETRDKNQYEDDEISDENLEACKSNDFSAK